ncbi:unnamed protein product [Hermetia illucens]|uniref:Uncharacterized protein n=2 Tax=Hermetia illucens TaxID=343691 RepID=A0A7R8UZ78_HERIL|nr:uncharacterized protein LOC119657734 isoform X1 [Hermetia illucens]CAD7089860.1 unnamed protein product [Hermetia illucens]
MDRVPVTIREVPAAAAIAARLPRGPARIEQRIVKEHLDQKYLLCGFAIHACIVAPVYLYGILVDRQSGHTIRIWPAILYQASYQVCQSFLHHTNDQGGGKVQVSEMNNRRIILVAALITCLAITLSGFLFSPSWVKTTTTTELLAVIIYGLFGGIGSSIIFDRTHLILEAVRPKEDKYVRKTVHLCGEAFCHLFLSFVISSLRTLYAPSLATFISGIALLNLIPLALLISGRIKKPALPAGRTLKIKEESRYESLPGFFKIPSKSAEGLDGIELQQKSWRSPHEVHCNYMAITPEEAHVAYINSNGVEIMEIIHEEDETTSNMRSSSATINTARSASVCIETPPVLHPPPQTTNLEKVQQFYRHFADQLLDLVIIKLVNPLQRAVVVPAFYPAMFLQSADVFSYVMCMTMLPSVAIDQHHIKLAEIPFLYSLLAFPWICFALMIPRFGTTLNRQKNKWHMIACLAKGIAFLSMSVSSSKLLLSVATVFLGFGQAVTMFLQDSIIQAGINPTKWLNVKYTMYTATGLLIILWGFLGQLIVIKYGFQANIGFVALIYWSSVTAWYVLIGFKLTESCITFE